MEFWISNLISGAIGLLMGLLFEEPLNRVKTRIIRFVKRLFFRPRYTPPPPKTFCFGGLTTSWIVLDGDGELEYTPETIKSRFCPNRECLPQDLSELRRRIKQQEKEKQDKGLPSYHNNPRYSLESFVLDRTGLEENLKLQLNFRPSDYFTFLATNMSLDEKVSGENKIISLREKYLSQVVWNKPVKFFSNSFGVYLAVITSDQYLIITQRSDRVGSRPGEFNISANEGLSRPLDRSDQSDAPDLYRCAIRGVTEELGIIISQSDIRFLSFGVDRQYSQWALLGMAKINRRKKEVHSRRCAGVKDKWENIELHSIPFTVDGVVRFVLSHNPWTPAALACIYHTLVHEFSHSKVDDVIKKYSNKQSAV